MEETIKKINTTGDFLRRFIEIQEDGEVSDFAKVVSLTKIQVKTILLSNEPVDRGVIHAMIQGYDLSNFEEEMLWRMLGKSHEEATCSCCGVSISDAIGKQNI